MAKATAGGVVGGEVFVGAAPGDQSATDQPAFWSTAFFLGAVLFLIIVWRLA